MTTGIDAEWRAAIVARINAETAHHEAGHAVAAVHRGVTLVYARLVDRNFVDMETERNGYTRHHRDYENEPFITYAGPWAEAMWVVENDPERAKFDFEDTLDEIWFLDDGSGSDTLRYESRVTELNRVATALGLGDVGRVWEYRWREELQALWPVICGVAALLIAGEPVTHEVVRSLLDTHAPGHDGAGE